jgi:heat shock protein HtpX
MSKRILLFVLTNVVIILAVSIVLSVLGVGSLTDSRGGLDLGSLAVICLLWGMGGALLSLQLSRWVAKFTMGVDLVDGKTGHADRDWLYDVVARQSHHAHLPMPEVGIYESSEVNAFATGPSQSRSLVAVSTGLLEHMERPEIEAVIGHEIGHIANGDMVTMTLIQGVVNAFVLFFSRAVAFAVRQLVDSRIAWLVGFLVMILLQLCLGLLGLLVTSWFSRQREFSADAAAATLVGRDKMIAALHRLQATEELVDAGHPSLAAFKISGTRNWLKAFSTHPPLEVRIAALEKSR